MAAATSLAVQTRLKLGKLFDEREWRNTAGMSKRSDGRDLLADILLIDAHSSQEVFWCLKSIDAQEVPE